MQYCRFSSSTGIGFEAGPGDHVRAYTGYLGNYFGADVSTNGTWSAFVAAPVPGPIVGAGLPGLMMAIAGFIGWRRSRRAITA